jgi:hypothetical protein
VVLVDVLSKARSRAGGALTASLAVAVVLAWLNGLLVRMVTVRVQLFGETADRSDYRVAAGAGLMTALLLLLGMVALLTLSAPAWLQYVAAAGVATQVALGVTAWWSSRAVDDSLVVTRSAWVGVRDVLLTPGSWLLLVVLVVAVVAAVRGRSRPTPR